MERAPIYRDALARFKLPQGGPYLPLPKCFADGNVSLRSMKLQKFRYRSIELCSHIRSPSLLPHSHPSALKRSESAFLFVIHIAPAANGSRIGPSTATDSPWVCVPPPGNQPSPSKKRRPTKCSVPFCSLFV